MGKPASYWIELDNVFGNVQDDPYVLLAVAEAKLDKLDADYAEQRATISNCIKQLLEAVEDSGK